MYKKQSKQLTFFDFDTPLGLELDPKNRYVLKADTMPWDEIEQKYADLFSESKNGNVALHSRLMVGALLLKAEREISDEEVVKQIQETPCLQYFCGLPAFTNEVPFHPATLTKFRKRLPADFVCQINELYLSRNRKKDDDTDSNLPVDISSPEITNKGDLTLDSTCAPQDIRFPTDLSLLNQARENLEKMIDKLHIKSDGKKPRTNRKVARKQYLKTAMKRQKSRKEMRVAVGKQIRFIRRDLKIVMNYLNSGRELSLRHAKRLQTILKFYEQQVFMYENKKHKVDNRIVSLAQPYVRPIFRGKARAKYEFGAQLDISVMEDGDVVEVHLERVSFDAYNEGIRLIDDIERYKKRYGYYPERVRADEKYHNKDNHNFCKEKGIEFLKKTTKNKKINDKLLKKMIRESEIGRIVVERKIGHAKSKFSLGLIKMRLENTSKTMIAMSILALNIARVMKIIFVLKKLLIELMIFEWVRSDDGWNEKISAENMAFEQ